MPAAEIIQSIASVSTAVGVGVAAWQLYQGRLQRCADFEQRLTVRYESIQGQIELEYLLEGKAYDSDDRGLRRAMFDYFELCEEERYYVDEGRASSRTWRKEWWPGIEANLSRPAFRDAWLELSPKAPNQFETIRPLVDALLSTQPTRTD